MSAIRAEHIRRGRENISRLHKLSPADLHYIGVQKTQRRDRSMLILLYNVTDPNSDRFRSTLSWVMPD
jgi:hypothetical protein